MIENYWWVRQELNLRSSLCKSNVITPRPRTPNSRGSVVFKWPAAKGVPRETVSEVTDLIEMLEKTGIPMSKGVIEAFLQTEPSDFTDFPLESFWHDHPVPFLITDSGVTKTISAPHMIATMLHHLELDSDLHVLLMGSKGGYLATLIDIICGKGGKVTIIEPHDEVAEYTSNVLEGREQCGLIRVLGKEALEDPTWDRDVDRVLFTGSIREIPDFIELLIDEGGFILGPFGGRIQQRLVKKEWQGGTWLETDLGGVVFGPMDIRESERGFPDPLFIADEFEDALILISSVLGENSEEVQRLERLVESLRGLPTGLPEITESFTDEEIIEHPVIELLMTEAEWLNELWPTFSNILGFDLGGGPVDLEEPLFGKRHADFTP